MAAKNEQAYALAQDWLRWNHSKRFYAPADVKNTLAQFMPSPSRDAPNAPLSPELYAFNLAVNSQDEKNLVPFIVVYCDHRPKPVKWIAHELGISRDTFYVRAHKTADLLVSITKRLSGNT